MDYQNLDTKKKPAQLTLFHKVVLLLAFPIALQFGLIACFSYLHGQAEKAAAQAEHTKMGLKVSSHLKDAMMSTMGMMAESLETGKPLDPRCFDNLKIINQDSDRLKEMVKDAPGAAKRLAIIDEAMKYFKLFFDRSVFALTKMKTLYPPESSGRKDVMKDIHRYAAKLDELGRQVVEEMPDAEETPRRITEIRDQQQQLLIWITFLNVMFLWLLAWFINHYIVHRLDMVIDNSFRLAARKPLNKPMSGSDEISILDNRFHGMARDLNDLMRKERAVVENSRDVICSLDNKGNFVDVSSASAKVFGYTPEELIGNKLINFVVEADASHTLTELKIIMDGGSEPSFENRILRKDGVVIDVLWSATWSQSQDTLFCVAHDMSERKQAERLRQEVVQMVSHDLRSPLTSIQGVIEMIKDGMIGKLDEKSGRLIAIADRNADRMLGLINDLLDIEKMESGMLQLHKEEVSVETIFEQATQSVQSLADERGVKLESSESKLLVFADSDRMVQIITNLLSNAVKFSQRDTKVTLSARQVSDSIEISVVDQGRGIPPEFINSIFDRFAQARVSDAKEQHGSGLGLAICKALIELHGGTISVHSEQGKGSTFYLRIPSNVKFLA